MEANSKNLCAARRGAQGSAPNRWLEILCDEAPKGSVIAGRLVCITGSRLAIVTETLQA
jgi:hypothetical protein